MKTSPFRTAAAALLAVSTVLGSLDASAQPNDNSVIVESREVFYGDLDLQSDAGVAQLHARITDAAKIVCGNDSFIPLAAFVARTKCRNQAIADAVAYVNLALLDGNGATKIELAQR